MTRIIIALSIALASCAGTATVGYRSVQTQPDVQLVEIRPGVYAMYDYNEPVFFADNYYWRWDAGRWYRSTYVGGGWVSARAPVGILNIHDPHRYVHYRPAPRERVVIRDHRGHWRRR